MMYACVAKNQKNPSETDQRGFSRGRGRKNEVLFFIHISYFNIRASFGK